MWYSMDDEQRAHLIEQVVRIEARLFGVRLPACGSVYYVRDLRPGMERVDLENGFCVGPDVHYKWWYSRAGGLPIDRKPCKYLARFLG